MLLREFLDNPVGKGDAAINVSVIKQALSNKYDKYIKSNKKVEMKVFRQPLKDVYWVWLIMPSETERSNTYDVVFAFSNPKPTDRFTSALGKFDIQIFANVPSFAYTHAYVYNQHGLLINSLSSKLGKTFISKAPDTRNRNQVLLFDKYVYFGARYIMDSMVLNRAVADARSSKYDEKNFNSKIRTLETIMEEYRVAENKLKKKSDNNEKKRRETRQSNDKGNVNRINGNKTGVKSVDKNAARKKTIVKRQSTIKKR